MALPSLAAQPTSWRDCKQLSPNDGDEGIMNLLLLTTVLVVAETRGHASRVTALPIAGVWQELSPHPNQKEPRQLDIGVWSDGTIVWRENDKHLTAKIDQREADKMLKDLDELKFFDDPEVNRQPSQYPPDAS